MLLHFNGNEYPVSEESVNELTELLYQQLLKQYQKLDTPSRVLLMPVSRWLCGQWSKLLPGYLVEKDKKADPTLKLARVLVEFVKHSAVDFEAEILIQADGTAEVDWYHPILSSVEVASDDRAARTG